MSAYTDYLYKIENALTSLVSEVVTKQKIDHPQLCEKEMKAKILSMYVDVIPLAYGCDAISEEELLQIENHIIKLTGDPTIGLIDQDDLSCGGIQTSVVHTIPSGSGGGSGGVGNVPVCASVSLIAGVPQLVTFGRSLGSSGSDWIFMGTPFCYDSYGIIAFDVTSRTANGFTVTAISNSTFTYCAIQK
jgi:hypothetical protein